MYGDPGGASRSICCNGDATPPAAPVDSNDLFSAPLAGHIRRVVNGRDWPNIDLGLHP